MIVHILNIERPWNKIKTMDLEIKICAKYFWAIHPDGRRYKFLTSAFLSMDTAEMRRVERLEKMAGSYVLKTAAYNAWLSANEALKECRAQGPR